MKRTGLMIHGWCKNQRMFFGFDEFLMPRKHPGIGIFKCRDCGKKYLETELPEREREIIAMARAGIKDCMYSWIGVKPPKPKKRRRRNIESLPKKKKRRRSTESLPKKKRRRTFAK